MPWAKSEPIRTAEARSRLVRWEAEFSAGESFIYAVFDPAETDLIGGAGLYRRVGPNALEIGYWIHVARTGRGYATEASRALTRIGFEQPDIARIQMHCDPDNVASKRIPQKLGYRLIESRRAEPMPDGTLRDTDVFELTAAEWRQTS